MPFALTIFLLSPLLLASHLAFDALTFTIVATACLVGGFAGVPLLSRSLCPWKRDDSFTPVRVCVALLVIGWGPLMAYQLGHVPVIGTLKILGSTGSAFSSLLPAGLPLLAVSQVVLVTLAGVLGLWVLQRTRRKARFVVKPAWATVYVLIAGYLALSVFLLLASSSQRV
jgi:hypothetical protein